MLQLYQISNIVGGSLHDKVEAILEFLARRRLVVDEHGDSILAAANNWADGLHKTANSRDFQAGAGDDEHAGSRLDICIHHRSDGLLIGVVFVVEDNAWAHATDTMAPLASCGADFVLDRALITLRWICVAEPAGYKITKVTTLLANHLGDAPM